MAAHLRRPTPRCCTRSNSVHSGHVGTCTSRLGAEATAARNAVDRSSISRSRSANSKVVTTPAVYHRAPTAGRVGDAATVRLVLFRVLGPVEVDSGDGAVLTLDRRRERLVLGILLLGAGRTISMDRLCDLVWDDDPPEHARRTVRTHVARIRSVLTRVRAHEHGVSLTFGHGSYLLTAPPDLIDAHRFRALLGQADDGADLAARDRLLREALSMWSGPALSDAATDRLRQRLCADLEELRLDAVEESAATGLMLSMPASSNHL